MKRSTDFILQTIGDISLIVPKNREYLAGRDIITTNETGSFLWNCLQNETTRDELIKEIRSIYDIDEETAAADIDAFLQKLQRQDALLF